MVLRLLQLVWLLGCCEDSRVYKKGLPEALSCRAAYCTASTAAGMATLAWATPEGTTGSE